VRWLHVAVEHATPVHVRQRARSIVEPMPKEAFHDGPARLPRPFNALRQRAARRVLHDDVQVAALGEVGVVLDQVGVLERLKQDDLALEFSPDLGRHVRDLEQLHCHDGAGLNMSGLVHLGKPPLSDALHHLVILQSVHVALRGTPPRCDLGGCARRGALWTPPPRACLPRAGTASSAGRK